MFDIFQMAFMQKALVIAIFISIVTPLIGNTIVLKRLSSIGDALSHAGLAGVAIGLCLVGVL
ncbi:MAG: metal ABC transporter permease [Muribaculaceae bacterium]